MLISNIYISEDATGTVSHMCRCEALLKHSSPSALALQVLEMLGADGLFF